MYGIPQEALAKILQKLVKAQLLVSQQGTNGGYLLARPPREISALEVIRAIEGPLFITSCSTGSECEQELTCNIRGPLRKVSKTIEEVLSKLTLVEMTESHEHNTRAELITLR